MDKKLSINNMNGVAEDDDTTCGITNLNCIGDEENTSCGITDLNCVGKDDDTTCGIVDMNCIESKTEKNNKQNKKTPTTKVTFLFQQEFYNIAPIFLNFPYFF